MVTCKNCRYWDAPDEGEWGVCELASSTGGRPDKETLAVAQDYESYRASLETKAEFGCVQGEVKE